MTIAAGYVDSDAGPLTLFSCGPKAGIWLNVGTPADTTEASLAGSNPGGAGVASMSVGFVDEDGDVWDAQYGSHNGGFDFNNTGSGVQPYLTGSPLGFSDRSLQAILELTSTGPGGWVLTSSGIGSDIRGYYLALFGDTMESEAGTFTLTDDSADVHVALGFTPDVFIVAGGVQGAAASGGIMQIGALDADGNQWAMSSVIAYLDAGATVDKQHYQANLSSLLSVPVQISTSGTSGHEATGAFGTDEVVITQVTPPQDDVLYSYLAVKDPGGGFAVGSGEMGDDVTGLSFGPEAVLFASVFQADESPHAGGGIGAGLLSAASAFTPPSLEEASVFTQNVQVETGGTGSRWRSGLEGKSLIQTDSGGSVLNDLETVLTADGFTVTASAGTLLHGWVAMRGSFQSGCLPSAFRPQIYRLLLP